MAKISFNFDLKKWEGITRGQVELWMNCYPDVDVVEHLTRRMVGWLDANPERAPKSQWKRFITNWLSSQQDREERWMRGR